VLGPRLPKPKEERVPVDDAPEPEPEPEPDPLDVEFQSTVLRVAPIDPLSVEPVEESQIPNPNLPEPEEELPYGQMEEADGWDDDPSS
jgi:hypothetical protein